MYTVAGHQLKHSSAHGFVLHKHRQCDFSDCSFQICSVCSLALRLRPSLTLGAGEGGGGGVTVQLPVDVAS